MKKLRDTTATDAATERYAEVLSEALAQTDPAFAELLAQREDARRVAFAQGVVGRLMPQPGAVDPAERALALEHEIAEQLQEVRLVDGALLRRSVLDAQRRATQQHVDQHTIRHAALVAQHQEAQAAQQAVLVAEETVSETRDAMAALARDAPDVIAAVDGVEIPTTAQRVADPRPVAASVAGLTTMLGVGLAVLVVGMLRGRVNGAEPEPLAARGSPLLVAVPRALPLRALGQPWWSLRWRVGAGRTARHQASPTVAVSDEDPAAQSVHQLRAVVESRLSPLSSAKCVALVGGGRGAGVTSLAVGLASSLAVSRTRVLLVDVAGLAHSHDRSADRTPGDAKAHAAAGQRRLLHRALEEVNALEREDADLLRDPTAVPVGLPAMLDGSSLQDAVVPTTDGRLSLLPAALAMPRHAASMSRRFLQGLLDQARREGYDAVVIDAGAGDARAEAMVAAAAADGAVVIAAPGLEVKKLDAVLARLRVVDAHVLGTVVNDVGPAGRGSLRDPVRHAASTAGSGIFAGVLKDAADPTAALPPYPQESADHDAPRLERLALITAMEAAVDAQDTTPPPPAASPSPNHDASTDFHPAAEDARPAPAWDMDVWREVMSDDDPPSPQNHAHADHSLATTSPLDPIVDQMIARAVGRAGHDAPAAADAGVTSAGESTPRDGDDDGDGPEADPESDPYAAQDLAELDILARLTLPKPAASDPPPASSNPSVASGSEG